MARRKQREGFWRWYLYRLGVGLLLVGCGVGVVAILGMFIYYAVVSTLDWLDNAPILQQISVVAIFVFILATIYAFAIYQEDC